MMTTGQKRLIYGAGGVLGVALLGWFALLAFGTTVLPRLELAPGFALTDQDGKRLTSEDLRGQVVVYSFGYTRCQTPVCRQSTALLQELQQRLPEAEAQGVPLKLVTVSVDPARDTPPALLQAAARTGADPTLWRFATGEPQALRYVLGDGFGIFSRPRADGAFDFSPAFIVVDGWGFVRSRYTIGIPRADFLLRDLRLITREARASSGTARYAYEMAHLFSCATGGPQ